MKFYNIKLKPLLTSIGIALVIGIIGSLLGNAKAGLANLVQPTFMPPAIVFPIVWTLLYIMMGVSAYIVYSTKSSYKKVALYVYATQLLVNCLWTLFFFRLHLFLFSFLWIILLFVLVLITAILFHKIKPIAGYLLIPYLLWLIFAAILNYSVYLLN